MTDFNAEAREAAKNIPDPRPSADVLRFPTRSERMDRKRRKWLRAPTNPINGGPKGAA